VEIPRSILPQLVVIKNNCSKAPAMATRHIRSHAAIRDHLPVDIAHRLCTSLSKVPVFTAGIFTALLFAFQSALMKEAETFVVSMNFTRYLSLALDNSKQAFDRKYDSKKFKRFQIHFMTVSIMALRKPRGFSSTLGK